MIRGTGLSFSYGTERVVDGVDLAADQGRVLGLIGPNGSGKTTLLRMLYGALPPSAGVIEVDGTPLTSLSVRNIAQRLSAVVQETGGESTLTATEMVMLGRAPHLGTFQRFASEDQRLVRDALATVGGLTLGARPFSGLSGGEKQRILIARALAQGTDHMLLDEPTNHLDIRYQHDLLKLVRGLGITAVVVLHDLNLAARYCDDLILLDRGAVAARGTVDEVLDPDLLEAVYGIGVRRVSVDGELHLLFHPRDGALTHELMRNTA
ncbi:iron complex transport system ATP-binding protein [Nocardioides daedukensis]|uniref:Iron complex transport system ATP-binding protein n=1 Tax=Nocardioides daedukensis TaxID=634462 RepID=A0A7Y9UN70_9ACTN|nr:ABC transporter ATP-binding protein [Nocardioides daedukensis]NYG58243.1 iron complex transport system ATP-binding protein [Nocardioides daedukensis]